MDRLTGPGWVALHIVVALCVLLFVPLGLGALGRGRQLANLGRSRRPSALGHEGDPGALAHEPHSAALGGEPRSAALKSEPQLDALDRARQLVRWWPVVAVPAVMALALPRGLLAGLLCLPYVAACLAVPVVLRRERLVAFAAACLPVAAAGLAAERAGIALLGFPAGVLGLTAAHFHVAGFGALLLLALTKSRYRLPAPVGVALVGAGFLIGGTPGDVVELIGAGVLTAGLWLALATRGGRGARWLFALSLVTMTLALLYAAGQVTELPHLGLTWMVLTHGVLNAGAVLTALVVAWAAREQSWSEHTWSHRIGAGRDRFEAASTALLTWDMHRRSGAWVDPATPPATPGLHMLSMIGFGRLRLPEPCQVTEVVRPSDRTTMHYLALPGHTFAGDESFTVLLAPDGTARFEVTVRSQPVHLVARLASPLVPVVQWLFIARCASALRTAKPVATPARRATHG